MSEAGYKRRSTCRLCSSTHLELAFSLAPTPPANAFVPVSEGSSAQKTFPLDVFFCSHCTHVQLLDVVDPVVLFSDYVYVSGTSPVFVKHFKEYAQTLLSRVDMAPDALVVEIGSNDGTLLREFKDRGFRVLGVDPARNIALNATKAGIETWPEFFDTKIAKRILGEKSKASIVVANNVIAHIDDLDEVIKGVRDVLAPNGIFAFEVSYLLDVLEKTLFDTIYHEHLDYHTVKAFKTFFNRHGMELIDAQRVSSHGGSLRGIVQLKGGAYPVSSSVSELITLEEQAGVDQLSTLQRFRDHIDSLGHDLKTLLDKLKREGRTIAGFGAPAKATTLMHQFGIDQSTIDFIVDDSPLKQGLLSPGLHIPIVASSAIAERKPDYLLILAWNFASSIIEKNRSYLASGGSMIVPIPKVEVISCQTS